MRALQIVIIGGGHMGQALVRGLLLNSTIHASDITIATAHQEKLNDFSSKTRCWVTTDNQQAVSSADIIFIAVKPAIVTDVVTAIESSVPQDALIISVAAVVSLKLLAKYFGNNRKLVRIMPNIPVALGEGIVGWIGKNIAKEDEQTIKNILSSLGLVIDCKSEDQLDRLSLISGCGPGIVAYIVHIFETISIDYGFDPKQSREIVLATMEGTINHMRNHALSSEELVEEVATKGGITEEIINNLKAKKTQQIFSQSLQKGYDKIKKLFISLSTQK